MNSATSQYKLLSGKHWIQGKCIRAGGCATLTAEEVAKFPGRWQLETTASKSAQAPAPASTSKSAAAAKTSAK